MCGTRLQASQRAQHAVRRQRDGGKAVGRQTKLRGVNKEVQRATSHCNMTGVCGEELQAARPK